MYTAALIVAMLCGCAFNAGKCNGSKKGFHMGRKKPKRSLRKK